MARAAQHSPRVLPHSASDTSQYRDLPQYQLEFYKQLQCLAAYSDIRWEQVQGCTARFNLLVPYCYELLQWQVEYQRIQDKWVPDLVFPDDSTFNPILPSMQGADSIASRLRKWDASDERQLHSLMKRVIQRFTAHQRALIQHAATMDPRLQFELDTMAGDGCPERLQLLFLHGQTGGLSKAIFVVGIDGLDFSCLEPFLSRNWSPSGVFPPDAIIKLGNLLFLKVAFPLSSTATPGTSLHMAEHLETVIGRPRLPQWMSGTTLMEYLPEVVVAIQVHTAVAAEHAVLRQELLGELMEGKMGQALEVDTVGARSAVFHITHDGRTMALYMDLPSSFPEDQPCLTLQGATADGTELTFHDYPWSPRWDAKEMARRIYCFVKGQVKEQASKRLSE